MAASPRSGLQFSVFDYGAEKANAPEPALPAAPLLCENLDGRGCVTPTGDNCSAGINNRIGFKKCVDNA